LSPFQCQGLFQLILIDGFEHWRQR